MKPGSHVKVVVDRIEHGGASVHIQGVLGKKGRGFIPNRELGSYGSGDKRRSLAAGQELEVKIAGVDRDGGYRLSIKGREVDDERKAVREYRKENRKTGSRYVRRPPACKASFCRFGVACPGPQSLRKGGAIAMAGRRLQGRLTQG